MPRTKRPELPDSENLASHLRSSSSFLDGVSPAAVKDQQENQPKPVASAIKVGLLILDSSLNPLYINGEAVKVLGFTDTHCAKVAVEKLILQKIRSVFLKSQDPTETGLVSFQSGRRRYVCRSFSVSPMSQKQTTPITALLIERNSEQVDLLQMAEDFRLTQRELEAVRLLALGLTSKEIATRMGISPNTVKAFLRLVMIKTGVSTRSGIIGRFLQSMQPLGGGSS